MAVTTTFASIVVDGSDVSKTSLRAWAEEIEGGAPSAFNAGTASLPGAHPVGDTNTGLWAPAADTLAWSTGGSERMRLDSSGKFGIGTTSPQYIFDTQTAAGSSPARFMNVTDSALNVAFRAESDRATPAASDRIVGQWYLSNSAGTQTEFGRHETRAATITAGAEEGQLRWHVMKAGALVDLVLMTSGQFRPTTSDGMQLGSASGMWGDLFLASGGVINWNAGDVTITHASDTLTFAGAASGYVFNNGNVGIGATPVTTLDVNGPVRARALTVATLPAATLGSGMKSHVTDSNATLAAGHGNIVAAGGTDFVPVYSDGTNWRIG